MLNTTVRQLIDSGKYGEFADYFWTFITEDHLNNPLSAYGYEACGFEMALGRCEELAKDASVSSYVYPIYSREDIYKEHDKQETKLIFFPRKEENDITQKTEKAFALVIPGGGFARQWTLIEGFAISAKLNEMGISAFVLLYRTAQNGVIKKALSDMYRAVSFIQENANRFDVNKDRYIMGGFSAGATLSGEMASDNLGWKACGVAKPELIFLGYPAQKMDMFYNIWKEAPEGSNAKESMEDFLNRIVDGNITYDAIEPYILEKHVSKDNCPPLYITANEDDPTVPFINSLSLSDAAAALRIPVKTKFGKTGGHSYGLGLGLEVEGWLEEAVDFWISSTITYIPE